MPTRRQNVKGLKKSSDQNSISHNRKTNIFLAPPRSAAELGSCGGESTHRPGRYVGADVPLVIEEDVRRPRVL